MIHFDTPAAFLLLLLLPLFVERLRRSDLAIRFATPVSLSTLKPSFRMRYRAPILTTLQMLTFCILVIALARPQTGIAFSNDESSARDILLTLDLSGSMEAVDFFIDSQRVTRLTALKAVVKDFVDSRQGDRIGLVVFGDHVFTQCPLTLDHKLLKEFVDSLEVGMAGKGTAIGDAIAISLKRIKDIKGDSKTVLLVTDGKSNSGSLSPEQAAEVAKRLAVKIHTIGIGTNGPAPFVEDGFFGKQLVNRPMEFDEQTLRQIATITSGQYFNATDTSGLERVYTEINALEERVDKTEIQVEYREQALAFLLAGLFLYFFSELLAATALLKVP